jgi:SPP1 gp7 family putative phage head morphogenesis protein
MAEPRLISVNLETRTAFFSDGSTARIDLRDEANRIVEEAAIAVLFTVRGTEISISLESAQALRLLAASMTANEAMLDALIRHQILLLRMSEDVRLRIQRMLDETEEDISDKIRSRLLGRTGMTTGEDERRLTTLLKSIRSIRTKAWEEITEEWLREAIEIAEGEPTLVQGIASTVAPVVLNTVLPPPEQLRALVEARPFEGRTLRQWAASIADEDLRRIEGQVRVGMISGEDSAQIARRVVGTARLRGVDGVTQITRRNAEAITRTMVNHFSNAARREFFLLNSDLFSQEQYVATLDSRTTPVCRSLDGKRYPVNEGPIPPLHFNCRSLRVPVLEPDILGDRPAKASTTRMLLREFARDEKITPIPRKRDDLPRGYKTRYDQFARRRVRELTGQVPGATTYQEWLTRQSAEFQDDVLGKARGALFRRGGLTLDRFVNRQGDEIPLRELARRNADAFRAAGLDPEDFL